MRTYEVMGKPLKALLVMVSVALAVMALPGGTASAQGRFGAALVPPPGLQPFADLKPEFPNRDASSFTLRYAAGPGAVGPHGGAATVAGSMGKVGYDQEVFYDATLRFVGCAPDAPYCAAAHMADAVPSSELFRGLQVNGAPAFATHIVCCNGHYWRLTWYDPNAAMTYRLEFEGGVADRHGKGIDSGNLVGAQALVDIGTQLVALR